MVWPFAPPDDGSVWQHGQAPPLFFSQKARMTARLSAPLFSIDSLLQSPLSNHREFCKELSERVYEIFLKCPVPERNRKILHFDGKWPRCRGPPSNLNFKKFRLEVANLEKLSQKRLCPEQVQRGHCISVFRPNPGNLFGGLYAGQPRQDRSGFYGPESCV